jgi:photosystem II stability/assembly factor-like uncharacterized protein
MKKFYTTLLLFLGGFLLSASAQTWTAQNIGYTVPAAYPVDIDAVDANTVWTATSSIGDGSGVTVQLWSRTIDGGNIWTSGSFTADTNYQVSNISGVDANTCFIMTFNKTVGSGGYLFKTSDGGATWDTVSTGQVFTTASSFPNVVHFFDANNGMMMGDPLGGYYEIYTTTDGGTTWVRTPQANIPNPLNASEYGLINVYGANGNFVYFGTNNGRVFRSYDRGLTWAASTAGTANTANGVTSLSFRDSLNGFVLRATTTPVYTAFRTNNAGATWTPVTPTGTFFKSDFQYVPGTTSMISVAAGAGGRGSSISYNDGSSWVTLDTAGFGTTDGYTSMDFFDATTGWAGGFAIDAITDGIYRWSGGTVGLSTPRAEATNINAYPNPSSNVVYLETSKTFKFDVTVSVVDVLGKTISSQNYAAWNNPVIVNLNGLENGIYFVRVSSGNEAFIQRVVKN